MTREFDQVAAVCYRRSGESLEFLLVRTRAGPWTFPKGSIEHEESPAAAAAREALEEAGATGEVSPTPFTVYLHRKLGGKAGGRERRIAAFLLEVHSTQRPLQDPEKRAPTWFGLAEAERALAEGREYRYAEEFRRVLRQAVSLIR